MSNASSIWRAWRLFCNGSLLYLAIPVAVLIFMLRNKKRQRLIAGTALLILFVLLYNPFSFNVLTNIVGASAYRVFWLLPGWAALAYIVYALVSFLPWEKVRYFAVLLLCILGMFFAVRRNEYSFSMSNLFQIPTDTIILAEDMMEIMDERGMETAVLYGNYDFLATLRQYSPRFILHTAPRNHPDMPKHKGELNYLGLGQDLTTGAITMDEQFASDILIDNEVYFIVLYRNLTYSIDYLGSMGWYEVAGTDAFVVLTQDHFEEDSDE